VIKKLPLKPDVGEGKNNYGNAGKWGGPPKKKRRTGCFRDGRKKGEREKKNNECFEGGQGRSREPVMGRFGEGVGLLGDKRRKGRKGEGGQVPLDNQLEGPYRKKGGDKRGSLGRGERAVGVS